MFQSSDSVSSVIKKTNGDKGDDTRENTKKISQKMSAFKALNKLNFKPEWCIKGNTYSDFLKVKIKEMRERNINSKKNYYQNVLILIILDFNSLLDWKH